MVGMLRVAWILLFFGGSAMVSCGATFEQLRDRAALDLDCPAAAIRARAVDNRTELVSGCDRQAIYVTSCGTDGTNCTWLLNSPIKPAVVQHSTPSAATPAVR